MENLMCYAAGAGGTSPSQLTPSSPPNGDCESRAHHYNAHRSY